MIQYYNLCLIFHHLIFKINFYLRYPSSLMKAKQMIIVVCVCLYHYTALGS